MPFFNRQNNDDLILAIQVAGVTRGRNGFRKDKDGEKLAESEEDLFIGCEKFPQSEISNISFDINGIVWNHTRTAYTDKQTKYYD